LADKQSGCRVMTVSGVAKSAGGASLKKGELLAGERWLELEPGASLRLKHTASGREVSFDGPGRLLPSVAGEEDLVVGLGTLHIQGHSGVRPGAQVVVGTPFGSVRYVDAQATLRVEPQVLSLTEASGMLTYVPPTPDAEPLRVALPAWRREQTPANAEAALGACTELADAAAARARELLTQNNDALGQRAAEHVRARQRARLSCATAMASALQLPGDEAVQAALGRVAELDARWRGIPSGP
jgi:hypothetical protein